jgi:hypothetical protein
MASTIWTPCSSKSFGSSSIGINSKDAIMMPSYSVGTPEALRSLEFASFFIGIAISEKYSAISGLAITRTIKRQDYQVDS